MSITLVPSRLGLAVRPGMIARWASLLLLLGAEVVALSLRFRVPVLPSGGPWWALPLAQARELWIPALLGAGTTAALAGYQLARVGGSIPSQAGASFGGRLAVHLAALAVFVAVTTRVFEGNVLAASWPAAWVLGWYAAGLVVVATWWVAGHPSGWRGVLGRSELAALAAGLAVGVGSVAASQLAGQLWLPMARATLVVARLALGLVASNVVADPEHYLLGVDDFVVRIAPTCSGYEGIGLVWVFLAIYLTVSRRSLRWPTAWWLIPLGTLAIWVVNAARITTLILIGAWWSPAVALGGFHSQAGSLGILAISLGLVLLSRRSRFFMAEPAGGVAPEPTAMVVTNPTAAYLVPFLAVVATTMITGAFSSGFDALYPLRIVAGGLALGYFARSYPGRLFDRSWFAVGVGALVFALWVALEPAHASGSSALRSSWDRLPAAWGWVWLGFRVVGSVVVVPLAEEWAFRGYLTRRLIASDFESVPMGRFTWLSFLLSSAAFGMLHGRWFAGMLAGLIYAGVYYRRGRVGDAALAHAVTNGLIAATVLVTGDWTMWS